MVNNIHIQINRTVFYKISKVSNPVPLKVTLYEPYDKLSNRFNRYTHVIQYPSGTEYKPDDYELCLDDPNAWYYTYILYLYKPSKKILSVDIYFDSNDKDKRNPLIFGFNQVDNTSLYYSYYHLRGIKYFTNTLGTDGLITKDDLISRLLDERGLYISESYNKFVIRLSDKPNDNKPVLYPKSGRNKEKITLQKSELQQHQNYVKYDHDINPNSNVESFYVSFHQDTLYITGDRSFGKLKEVHVYYNKHDGDIPVVVVFKFRSRTKLYKFYDFYNDSPKKTKNISELPNFSDVDLVKTLNEEYKRVKKELTFNKGRGDHKYISITSDRFFMDNKNQFRRAILRPNIDSSKGGDPTGPYEVYSDNLFQKYSDKKIHDESVLSDVIGKKFGSIYVYYTSTNEPLLVGFIGESENKFVRISKGGKTWEKEPTSINIYNLGHLLSKLRHLEREKNFSVSVQELQPGKPFHQPGQPHPLPTAPRPPPPPRPSAPPTRPPTRERELVEIDLSINSQKNYGPSSNITVSKHEYSLSQLFWYFKHSYKDNSSFTISSLLTDNGRKKVINIHNSVKLVKSVNVYFNKFNTKIPVMIDITSSDNSTKYYANIIQDKQSYDFSTFKLIQKEDLTQTLIEESDRVNKTLTYQLEKTFNADSNTYGYQNGIKITKNEKSSSRYTIYTHEPAKGQSSKSYVLFNHTLVVPKKSDKKNDSLNIQEKTYKNIKTYSLNNDSEFPLIIQLNEDKTNATTHLCRMDGSSQLWEKKTVDLSDTKVELGLFDVFYPLKHSVIVEIDKNNLVKDKQASYPMKMISNKKSSNGQYEKTKYDDGQSVKSKTVTVSDNYTLTDFSSKTRTLFYYVSHELEEAHSQSINTRDIAGVRLFASIGVGIKPEELFFYESQDNANRSLNRLNLYYPPQSQSKKIYVYFYDDDPRPLLVCYDGTVYKKLKDINKWVLVRKVNCSDSADVLKILKDIYGTIKKKLTLVKDGNIDNKINFKKDQSFGTFKQDIYTVKLDEKNQKTSFRLPITNLVDNLQKDTSLSHLFDFLFNKPFDSINVYKKSTGLNVKNILVFEFINESRIIHLQRKDIESNYWVNEHITYENDKTLQEQLLSIKSKIEKTILYEIDKKTVNYNNYIFLETSSLELSDEYTEYLHSPQPNYDNHFGCLLYKGERLMVKNSKSQIVSFDSIHDKPYDNVSVYFGSRKKDVPLILEFTFSNSYSSNTYYKHIVLESSSYWETIQISSGISESEDLLYQLKLVEASLFQSVIILMDIREGKYGDTKIKEAIPKLTKRKEINTYPMDQECITVNDITYQSKANCISNSGFGVYEHNLNNCVKNDHSCLLRFFMFSNTGSNNYTELNLYNHDSIENLYYSKPSEAHKVYIYFYKGSNNIQLDPNEENDPRPLLIFYGNRAYRPLNKQGYFDKWYADSTITDFLCQRSSKNPHLIKGLSNVIGFLNEVQLYQRPHDTYYTRRPNEIGHKTSTYEAHIFNNKQINIQVSYYNGYCFRYYRHEPYGVNGHGYGYRLGNIVVERHQGEGLNYENTKQLAAVNLYYYVYDYNHSYPLLISLEFKEGDNNEYYELNDKREKKWRRITENVDDRDIEYRIKSLMKKLEIEFKKGQDVPTLFDPDQCHDDSSNTTLIAAASGGTVTTAALVGGGVTLAVHPEWVVPVIKALV